MSGKGSKQRPESQPGAYADGFDRIFRGRDYSVDLETHMNRHFKAALEKARTMFTDEEGAKDGATEWPAQ